MEDASKWVERQKASWMCSIERVGHDLFQEFEGELERREKEKHSLSEHIADLVLERSRLVEENNRLHNLISKHVQSNPGVHATSKDGIIKDQVHTGHPGEPEQQGRSGRPVSYEEYHYLAEKYNDLSSQYKDLYSKHRKEHDELKHLREKNKSVMEKNAQMKECVLAWQQHLDKRDKRDRARQTPRPDMSSSRSEMTPVPALPPPSRASEMLSPPVLPSTDARPVAEALSRIGEGGVRLSASGDLRGSGNHIVMPLDLQDCRNAQVQEDRATGLDTLREGNAVISSPRQNVPAATSTQHKLLSSQATQDDDPPEMAVPSEPTIMEEDEDVPIVVSERSLKRKRAKSPKVGVYRDPGASDGTPANPYRIKEEPTSSPPMSASELHPLTRKETLDLDDLGAKFIHTPRRNHAQKQLRRREHNIVGHLRHERSRNDPINEERNDLDVEIATRAVADSREWRADERAQSGPPAPIGDTTEVLQPMDPNIRRLPDQSGAGPPKKRSRNERDRYQTKLALLAESGEYTLSLDGVNEPSRRKKRTPNAARMKYNERLRASKGTPSTFIKNISPVTAHGHTAAQEAGYPTPDSAIKTSTKQHSDVTPLRPTTRQSAVSAESAALTAEQRPNSRPSSSRSSTKRPSDFHPSSRAGSGSASGAVKIKTNGSPPPPPQPQQPLRSLPPSALKLTDFKANPAYNQGYSHPFQETVRNRSDRACLLGCTKPDCCGSTFRALAAVLPALSSSQESSLLQDFLGEAYDESRVLRMMREERDELVLQARTRELAQKHGKHRQAYERRATPPGFWRTDFPTTQEQMEDREKAAQMERDMVAERYAEAMRRGGRWIFRDEQPSF